MPVGEMHTNQGIQQLLAAEKIAAEKVAEARKRRVKRLKEAKEQAQTEIEAYRLQREKSYQEFERSRMGTKEDVVTQIEKDTSAYIESLEGMVSKNRDQVITDLIELVVDIQPKIHPNFFVLKAFNAI